MSTNGNIFRHFIKLLVRGFERPFIYEVGSEEVGRLRSMLVDLSHKRAEKKLPNLFMFNAVNNLVVGVSPSAIQLAHFLFERSTDRFLNQEDESLEPKPKEITNNLVTEIYLEQEGEDLEPERSGIHLYLRGRTEPFKVSAAESGDAAALCFQLETGTFESREFYSFIDIDGEEVAICLRDLVVVELRKDVLNEGVEESREGEAELDDF